MTNFIVYTSSEQDDIIVTTKKNEKAAIALYFNDTGRDIDEYERQEVNDIAVGIEIKNNIWIG